MSDNLTLAVARNRIRQYADESAELMQHHAEAMECRDGEEFLQRGIEALHWLIRAEEVMRAADADGLWPFDPNVRGVVDQLYVAWLEPKDFAERWISSLEHRGLIPDNVRAFRAACELCSDMAERRDWMALTANIREQCFAAEDW